MAERTVLALGGHCLLEGEDADHASQPATIRRTVRRLGPLQSADRTVVWTHGNGPQVGNRLLEQAAADTPAHPLDVLVAETQGHLGYLLARVLDSQWNETALPVTTQAVVDADDPAFESPSKPVGPRYTAAEAERKPFETAPVEGGNAHRRVVPSPRPQRIVEADAIESLVDRGQSVICGGGGGVPIVETDDGLEGREAVIDKDHTSALLGRRLDARELVFLTDVPYAYLDYGTDEQRPIEDADPATLREYLDRGEFGTGSMRPKVDACARFVAEGGERAIITTPESVDAALAGDAGTQIR
ncbi:carbamate kinase [Haloplanus halobius]|uniref:carbamate kinase n=1 Tax=Haloplanus halobius TaxID=2934938 RepID=UPI00200EF668